MLGRLVVTLITQSQKKSQVDLTGRLGSLAANAEDYNTVLPTLIPDGVR